MQRGRRVVLADLRGMGRRLRIVGRGEAPDSPLGQRVKEAFLSLHIGRPLLGQRVIDLLVLLESLNPRQATRYDRIRARSPPVRRLAALARRGT